VRNIGPELTRRAAHPDPGALNQLAIDFPAQFIRREARYQWTEVLRLYREGVLRHPNGGMQSLLNHREQTVRALLDVVKAETGLYARAYWQNAAFSHAGAGRGCDDHAAGQYADAFAKAREPLRWEADGSTTPTSDLDVSLQGGCTEYAVLRFNALFADLHDGNESGVVFDTNLYAADFVPTNQSDEFVKQGAEDSVLVPIHVDHAFTSEEVKRADDERQESVALLHLRRYVTRADWARFGAGAGAGNAPLRRLLKTVDGHYRNNRAAIASRIVAAASEEIRVQLGAAAQAAKPADASLHWPPQTNESWTLAAADAVIGHAAVTPNARMAAENRLYEARLARVADLRRHFLLLQHDLAHKQRAAAEPLPARDILACDRAYLDLRAAISDACYFANECYASAGAKIQVVGGKQKWSKGVALGKLAKADRRNIDYTAEMLLHSLLEQTGDLFKEIRHHANGDLGGAALAASKYLHRWFNAMNHLYRIMGKGAGRAFPPAFPSAAVFTTVRRACGYGLEMLKRLPTGTTDDPVLVEPHKRDLARRLYGNDARWQELGKDSPAVALRVVREQFAKLQGQAAFTGEDCESFLRAILFVTAGIVQDYHIRPAGTQPAPGQPNRVARN
jgi:hypothetical protein